MTYRHAILVVLVLAGGSMLLPAAPSAQPPLPPWFHLRATYADGSVTEGYDLDANIPFQATTVDGQKVDVVIGEPPHWYTAPYEGSAVWDAERNRYVFRSPAWTAEFSSLWETLDLKTADGKSVAMPGKDLQTLVITYNRAPKPKNNAK